MMIVILLQLLEDVEFLPYTHLLFACASLLSQIPRAEVLNGIGSPIHAAVPESQKSLDIVISTTDLEVVHANNFSLSGTRTMRHGKH